MMWTTRPVSCGRAGLRYSLIEKEEISGFRCTESVTPVVDLLAGLRDDAEVLTIAAFGEVQALCWAPVARLFLIWMDQQASFLVVH